MKILFYLFNLFLFFHFVHSLIPNHFEKFFIETKIKIAIINPEYCDICEEKWENSKIESRCENEPKILVNTKVGNVFSYSCGIDEEDKQYFQVQPGKHRYFINNHLSSQKRKYA